MNLTAAAAAQKHWGVQNTSTNIHTHTHDEKERERELKKPRTTEHLQEQIKTERNEFFEWVNLTLKHILFESNWVRESE